MEERMKKGKDGTAEEQVERLAKFIMDEVPGEPSRSEGAVDTAIRIIKQLMADKSGGLGQKRNHEYRNLL